MVLGTNPDEVCQLNFETSGINMMSVIKGFADAVTALDYGTSLSDIGIPVTTFVERKPLQPLMHDDYIEGQIIYIDRFENVVVNITREQFEHCRRGRSFKIFVMRDDYISHISESYSDVPEGGKVAMFNTAGYLEIAINKGNAAGLFGLQSYSRDPDNYRGTVDSQFHKHLFYQTIRIHFE